jgi:hypothetical protein
VSALQDLLVGTLAGQLVTAPTVRKQNVWDQQELQARKRTFIIVTSLDVEKYTVKPLTLKPI